MLVGVEQLQLEPDEKFVLFSQVALGVSPKTFQFQSCTLLGCSATTVSESTTLPDKPLYLYIINHDTTHLAVNIKPPNLNENAALTHFYFTTTCYGASLNVHTNTVEVMVGEMTEDEDVFQRIVETPIETSNTCRIDAKTCTYVGCSLAVENWNIGLDAPTTGSVQSVKRVSSSGNITVRIISMSELNKADPDTTDIRWRHVISTTETSKTIDISQLTKKIDEDGITEYLGFEILELEFSILL